MPKKADQDMNTYLAEMHKDGTFAKKVKAHKKKGPAGRRIVHTRKMHHKQQAQTSKRFAMPKADEFGFY